MVDMVDSNRPEQFALLYDLGCAFAARLELDELIPLIVTKCREVLNAEGISVLLLDPEHNQLYFPYVAQADPAVTQRLVPLRFPAELGIAGTALKTGKAIRVDNAQSDPRLYHGVDQATGITTRQVLAVPLTSHQGTIGVIEAVNSRAETPFTGDDLSFLEALAGSIAIAIENARLYATVKDSEASLRTKVGALSRDLARHDGFTKIIGTAPSMVDVFRLMESAAATSIPVMIEGETGTGKELVARAIHKASARCDGPFLAINCASLPETLLESELFGHRRGAFTGAVRDNPGLFRAAGGGVVFLDEVADMPLSMQAKLLRVLEEEEVVAIGDSFPRKVDVRVLSATNSDLKAEVDCGNFRQDLYYRIAVFPIRLPPLRERREDIPVLASWFLTAAAERQNKRIAGLDAATMELLTEYQWPGNVRELRNEIERAVALAKDNDFILPGQLTPGLSALSNGEPHAPVRSWSIPSAASVAVPSVTGSHADIAEHSHLEVADQPHMVVTLREARAVFEARHIAEVLRQHQSNVSRSAQALGVSRAALQKKMKIYRLR